MKILVVEDKEMHRQSARETLEGHDLTIASSFDEGIEALSTAVDYAKVELLRAETGLGKFPGHDAPKEEQEAYRTKDCEIQAKSCRKPNFEVVLVDMMMPMSKATLGPGVWNPKEEVPYGFILALRAAKAGAKYVAMVTDTNHHDGAMSAAIDHLGSAYYRGSEQPFEVDGAKVLFLHTPFVTDIVKDTDCKSCSQNPGICPICKGSLKNPYRGGACASCEKIPGKCNNCKGTTKYDEPVRRRKDWGRVLQHLTTGLSSGDQD